MSFWKQAKLRWVDTVHGLRRWPVIHQPAKWLKDNAWAGLVEGGLECSRRLLVNCPNFGPPTGFTSLYQSLRTGDPPMEGRIILHDQGVPQVSPDSLLVRGGYRQHKEQPWPIFWCHLPQARLATEGLALLLDRKTVCLESVYGQTRLHADPAYRFLRLPPPVRLAGNWTSVVSRWSPCGPLHRVFPCNHSHWMLDALPRLALLHELPRDTQIIVPANLFPQHKESLAMLGLLDRCRFTTERHLEIEHYYFSSQTAMLCCHNPYAVEFLRRSLLPHRDRSYQGPRRFLVKRSKDRRTAVNEAELEAYLIRQGYVLVDVGTLSLARQIQLFHEAEAIAAFSGSALTNTLFCQPGCRVAGFMFDYALDGWVDWIAQVAGFTWQPLVIPTDYTRQYTVDLAAVKALVEPA